MHETPKLMQIERDPKRRYPRALIGGTELPLLEYEEKVSHTYGHVLTLRFLADYAEFTERVP